MTEDSSSSPHPPVPSWVNPGNDEGAVVENLAAPAYPVNCRRRNHEGIVILQVHVHADGSIDRIRLRQQTGCERLVEAAIDAVGKATFRPARRGDVPVDSVVIIPFRFELE